MVEPRSIRIYDSDGEEKRSAPTVIPMEAYTMLNVKDRHFDP